MDNIRFDINATDKSKPAFDSVRASADKTSASVKQFDRNMGEMTGRILSSAPAFAVATAAIAGVYEAIRLVTAELAIGFNAVEEYRQSVIQMAAVMTNFSQKAKEGDVAGAWKEASAYAKVMVNDLELIDAKSLASGQNIIDMTRTMLTYGVQIDTNISSQRDALVTLSNAIAIATAGQQNANLQYVQEIRGLMEGVSKPGNVLVAILERAGVNVKQFSEDMQLGKKSVADLLPYLSGFMSASEEIAYSWGAIKSTLETTNKRVLRDGFLPVYRDILDSTTKLMRVFMDQNGVLTEQGKIVQESIVSAWKELRGIISAASTGLKETYRTYQDIKALYDSMPLSKLIDFGVGTGKTMGLYALRGGPLHYVNIALDEISAKAKESKKALDEVGGGTGVAHFAEVAGPPVMAAPPLSDDEKKSIDDSIKALQKTREEWEKTQASLSKQVALGGLTGLAKELKQLNIEHAETVAKFKGFDTSEIDRFYEELAGQARQDAIKKIDTDLKSFFEDIDSFGKEALLDNALTDFFSGLDETSVFLQKQRELIEDLNTAALPEHARQIEEVTKKYQEYDRVLSDLVALGSISFEEAVDIDFGLAANWQTEMDGIETVTLDTTTKVSTFWEEAQKNMQNTSKSFFFDAMKGELTDLGARFEDMILDMVANWQAAQLQMALWGDNASAAGGFGNGLISMAADWISPGTTTNAGIDAALSSYYNFAAGGVMTGAGPLPLRRYASGGVANSPQMAIYGEGSKPEAYVPLEDGRTIPVTVNGGGGGVIVNVINNASGAVATKSERTDGGGNRIIDVLVEQVESKMGDNIARGKGLAPVMESRWPTLSSSVAWGMNR